MHHEKELNFSIGKFFELYHLLLLLLLEIKDYYAKRLDIARGKFIPDPSEINEKQQFANNLLLKQLEGNEQLNEFIRHHKISWVQHPDLIKNLARQIDESDFFNRYKARKETTYNDDKTLILNILSKIFPQSEDLINVLEEKSIYWNDDFEFAISMIIVTIKAFEQEQDGKATLLPLYKNDDDGEFARRLFLHAVRKSDDYEQMIIKNCHNWDPERITLMDFVLMKTALSEIMEFPTIPIKVTLNEFLDFSKIYSTERSHIFINGILDRIVKELTEENQIKKTGRGLLEHKVK